jgi:hypothetical protein
MHSKLLLQALLCTGAAFAGCAAQAQPAEFRGNAAPLAARAGKVIVITPATRHVNVDSDTTVRFVVGDQAFNWRFGAVNGSVVPFDLQRIAPQGMLGHPVTVYVADGPLYEGG